MKSRNGVYNLIFNKNFWILILMNNQILSNGGKKITKYILNKRMEKRLIKIKIKLFHQNVQKNKEKVKRMVIEDWLTEYKGFGKKEEDV